LALVELGFFLPGMTMGAGFLAVALAMLGRRAPVKVALFALAFGLLAGLDTGLQVADVNVRTEFLQMLPYVGIILAVLIVGRHARDPRALGRPYRGIGRDQ
jgi:simple sugar transport system permease protein